MPAEPWPDVVRMVCCLAVTAVFAAPLLLVGGTVATAVRCWAVVAPAVLLLHGVVNALFLAAGVDVQEHPLAKEMPHPVILVVQACLYAPLVEELIFRGLYLRGLRMIDPWLSRVVLAASVGVAVGYGGVAPAVFAGLVALVWLDLRNRSIDRGVYGAAALFAAVHSGVWPTPIPLFALGLGLGWVAVRTNGILAPFLVHALFNTVSVLFVLSGGAK